MAQDRPRELSPARLQFSLQSISISTEDDFPPINLHFYCRTLPHQVRYVIAVAATEYYSQEATDRGATDGDRALLEENQRLKNALDRATQGNTELRRQLNNVSHGAMLDANEELQKERSWRKGLEGDYNVGMAEAKGERAWRGIFMKGVGV